MARTWWRRLVLAAAPLALVCVPVTAASAQERYALLVEGASGEPQYATLHRQWLDQLRTTLVDRFKLDASHVVVLAEKAGANETRSTAENLRAAVATLVPRITTDDLLFVVLIGHGSAQGGDAKFNLIGPDLSATEWAELFKPVAGRLAFVNTSSASFPYLAGLAGPGRVVITATRSVSERYHTRFAEGFVQALTAEAADADKNKRVSLLEAFTHATRLVAQHYEQNGHIPTEHAMLDDTGDGKGRDAATQGEDGTAASMTYLDAEAVPTSSDPAVLALIARQGELTRQIDDLRRRRAGMAPIQFDQQFEPLIIELATVSREVRRKTGG
jgi:hypothetical protein